MSGQKHHFRNSCEKSHLPQTLNLWQIRDKPRLPPYELDYHKVCQGKCFMEQIPLKGKSPPNLPFITFHDQRRLGFISQLS